MAAGPLSKSRAEKKIFIITGSYRLFMLLTIRIDCNMIYVYLLGIV